MRPPLSVDLALDPATVRRFIDKAKALSADLNLENLDQSADTVEFDEERLEDTHHHDGLAEEEAEDLTSEELRELIDDLNTDEAASLVAIAWVGRGDFEANDFTTALSEAKERAEGSTSAYLMGMPLLAEHLESGLDSLGV
jgi:glycine/D-amino acid oxidase-like deaminating enzyme